MSVFDGNSYTQLTYLNVTEVLRINGIPVIAGGVASVTGGNVDNTDPTNPVVNALVETVTGGLVDNTDPLNPVINNPTSTQTSNESAAMGATVTDALNELLTQQNILRQRMHFVAGALDDVTVNTDPNNPSFLTDMLLDPGSFGVTLDTPTGAVKNVTGRTIAQAVGTISFQPDKAGGGVTLLHLWSERSMDNGATWIQNANSLRVAGLELR